MEDTQ